MAELFDPDFTVQINCKKDIKEVRSEFQSKFEFMMIEWEAWVGQSEDYYFDFHRDRAYELGLSPYPYELFVSGNDTWEDATKQEAHKAFARSVVTHFQEQGYLVNFSAHFTLDDE